MATQVLIAGLPVLMNGPVEWVSPSGTQHGQHDFDVPLSVAEKLMDFRGQPISLTITPDVETGKPPAEIQNLFILGKLPGTRPTYCKVRVVDRRYWWQRWHVLPLRFNLRRKVGAKRIVSESADPALQPVTEDLWYLEGSLNNGRPWKASEVLNVLGAEIIRFESLEFGAPPFIEYETAAETSIENLEIEGALPTAIGLAMRAIPDLKLILLDNGNVRFSDRGSGKDADVSAEIGGEKYDQGHVEFVDNSAILPKRVDVFFPIVPEVRFDFDESKWPTGTTQVAGQGTVHRNGVNDRYLINVLSEPTFDDVVNSQLVVTGSWVPISSRIDSLPNMPGQNFRLSYDLLRQAFVPYVNLWSVISNDWNVISSQTNDWPALVGAFKDHYRQTFQISKVWGDRILAIKDERIGLTDPQRGTRARAAVYCKYAVTPSAKGFQRSRLAGPIIPYVVNRNTTFDGGEVSEAYRAPATISISDPDQQVFHVNFHADVRKFEDAVLPSSCDNVPVYVISKGGNSLFAFNQIIGNEVPKLSAAHKLSVVLTCIPLTRCGYKVSVYPSDVAHLVPATVNGQLGNCTGPTYQIGTSLEAARIPWADSRASFTEAIFGIGAGSYLSANPQEISEMLRQVGGMVINDAPQAAIGNTAASLPAIAQAFAARIYTQLAGRLMGRKVGKLTPGVSAAGWIESVTHGVTAQGEPYTSISFPDQLPQMDILAWMAQDTRAILLREIQRSKS